MYTTIVIKVNGEKVFITRSWKGRVVRKYGPDDYTMDGYDRRGFDRNGIHRITGTRFNTRGKDVDGYNKSGFKNGLNRFGFRESDHKHCVTGKDVDEQGYNFYGLDLTGCDHEGFKDPDVAILEDYIAARSISSPNYAKENDLETKEVKKCLKRGLLKAPWLKESYRKVSLDGQAKLMAIIHNSASEVKTIDDLRAFWETHPKLDLSELRKMFGNGIFNVFINILSDSINAGPVDIELLIRSFNLSYFKLEEGLFELNKLRKVADRDTRVRLNTIEKYMKKFSAKVFYPGTYTVKGKTTIVTEEDIECGKEILKAAKRFICARTLEKVCLS